MKIAFKKKMLAAVVAGMCLPLASMAAEADLMKKIDELSRELQALKAQVTANEKKAVAAPAAEVAELKTQINKLSEKSLSKWLDVSGDYRFRVDSLKGETKPFMDVSATFANAQNSLQIAALGGDAVAQAQLTGMVGFQNAMNAVKTYADALPVAAMVPGMMPILGAYAVMPPAYTAKNASLYSNRFGLDLSAKATQDITVNAHLAMYKLFGSQSEGAVTNAGSAPFFADRVGVFDGTLSHVPSSSYLNVDRVYATWANIADEPIWFSVGRRPSTGGAPSHLKNNNASPGNGGTPSLLVDYAFDGMTIGYAPDIDGFAGAYGKICYGRGFESGYSNSLGNSLKDTDMLGVAIIPIDTDPLRVWLQWNRGFNIFDAPTMRDTYFGNTAASTNLGDIDWYGVGFQSTLKNIGSGKLNFFGDLGVSVTHPNNNVSAQFGFQGLMTGSFFNPEAPTSKTGYAAAVGVRYDLPSNTKVGFEYNYGSKNWITFAPAADDMVTAKVGTRGNVYELYVIQELDKKPVSSFFSKAFFRLGAQYYDFKYTGSNNWVGAPVAIDSLTGAEMSTMTPLKSATNIYATFEVKF